MGGREALLQAGEKHMSAVCLSEHDRGRAETRPILAQGLSPQVSADVLLDLDHREVAASALLHSLER